MSSLAWFMVLAWALVGAATSAVVWPLVRKRSDKATPLESQEDTTRQLLRVERAELKAAREANALDEATYQTRLTELLHRAHAELPSDTSPTPNASGSTESAAANSPLGTTRPDPPRWRLAIALALAIPLASILGYLALGTPQALTASVEALKAQSASGPSVQAAQPDAEQFAKMVDQLKARMEKDPSDPKGWQLLGRSLYALGRHAEAAKAYERLVSLAPPDADTLADYADALAVAQDRTLDGKPITLVEQALKLNPQHPKALALSATHAMNQGRSTEALALWRRLLAASEPSSEDAKQIAAIIKEIEETTRSGKAQMPGATQAGQSGGGATASSSEPARKETTSAASVSGRITVSAAMQSRLKPGSTLFVVARETGGGRMPIAVWRVTVDQFPMNFTLDERHAMVAGRGLGSVKSLDLEARVSQSGTAQAQAGDLRGELKGIAPQARDLLHRRIGGP